MSFNEYCDGHPQRGLLGQIKEGGAYHQQHLHDQQHQHQHHRHEDTASRRTTQQQDAFASEGAQSVDDPSQQKASKPKYGVSQAWGGLFAGRPAYLAWAQRSGSLAEEYIPGRPEPPSPTPKS